MRIAYSSRKTLTPSAAPATFFRKREKGSGPLSFASHHGKPHVAAIVASTAWRAVRML
jgi:hypothetical protein